MLKKQGIHCLEETVTMRSFALCSLYSYSQYILELSFGCDETVTAAQLCVLAAGDLDRLDPGGGTRNAILTEPA
jgi:hypothetical protein